MIDEIVRLIDAEIESAPGRRPFVVGIAGGVGVGKTTLANALAEELAARGRTTLVLATDNFLFSNAELAERGLLMQKGFPDSYDVDALLAAVATLRSGDAAVVPVYDHQTYDIVDDRVRVEATDVLLLEGVNVLQPSVLEAIDLPMYIDVDVGHARAWFFDRFASLCERGEGFYAPFATMSAEERATIAEAAWSGINLVNLEEHIEPTRRDAKVVVRKQADHTIVEVRTA